LHAKCKQADILHGNKNKLNSFKWQFNGVNFENGARVGKARLDRGGVLNKYPFMLCLNYFTQNCDHIFRTIQELSKVKTNNFTSPFASCLNISVVIVN